MQLSKAPLIERSNKMRQELPNLMTPRELMSYLKCSKTTAYALCRRKDFPSFRVGKTFYIQQDKIYQWIENESHKNKY